MQDNTSKRVQGGGREPTQPIDLEEVEGALPVKRRAASLPPPVPPQALMGRPSRVPGARPPSSAPPPPPSGAPLPAGTARSTSGVRAVESPLKSQLPPRPAQRSAASLAEELKGVTAERDRLRLHVVQRQDRIKELETRLAASEAGQRTLSQQLELTKGRAHGDLSNLRRIAGVGPAFERALKSAGVDSIARIAEWTAADIQRIAPLISTTHHRIERDGWVQSARQLLER